MVKQSELFRNPHSLGTSPKKRAKQVMRDINKTRKRLERGHPETEEEHEAAENGGTEYWSTFRR